MAPRHGEKSPHEPPGRVAEAQLPSEHASGVRRLRKWLNLPPVSGIECADALRRAGFRDAAASQPGVVELHRDGQVVAVPLAIRLDFAVLVAILQKAGVDPAYFLELLDGSNTNVDDPRRANERYRATFCQAPVGMAEVALDGRLVQVNDRLCQILGYAREELEQRTFQEITHPADLVDDEANTRQLLTAARPTYSMEKRYVRKNGSPLWARLTVALVRTTSGSPDYFISVVEDIDEAKRDARECEVSLEREQRAREEAEHAGKFAELFVALLGHDLRNPLNTILMSGSLLARTDDQRSQQAVTLITSSAQRMARMIEQILDFSRIRWGQGLPHEPTAMDLRDLLSRVVQELTSTKGRERVRLEIRGDTHGHWDDDRLAQVFSNLLANALEHSPDGAPVRVSVDACEASNVAIAVQNLSTIPAELVPELFEPFRKARHQAKSRGLGLGLYITKQIVEAHGGTIEVSTSDAGGTRFRVVLPRAFTAARGTAG